MTFRLLDLCCGAGGATKGYQRAGFYVVGVDIKPQPNYCGDAFSEADAMGVLRSLGHVVEVLKIDAIHASPPCQFHTIAKNNGSCKDAVDLVPETLAILRAQPLPWVIENVAGAPLPSAIQLCANYSGALRETSRRC